jgi:hypothetical protein
MAHFQYKIYLSGTYYYDRRVPKHEVEGYGPFIRQALSSDPQEAKADAERLGGLFEGSWSTKAAITLIDIISVVEGFKPRTSLLSEMAGSSWS